MKQTQPNQDNSLPDLTLVLGPTQLR